MGLLSVSERGVGRITDSVQFTESYQDRIKRLIGVTPQPSQGQKFNQPIRAILLQDCYGGQDALAVEISRNDKDTCTLVSLVGDFGAASTANTFKLQLFATNILYGEPAPQPTLIGTSGLINALSGPNDLYAPLSKIDSQLDSSNTWITLGNPYSDDNLVPYGNVVPASADENNVITPAKSYISMWAIQIDPTVYGGAFTNLVLQPFIDSECRLSGLLGVTSQASIDLCSPETTVVSDIYYRTQQFPWQAGTIVTCLDFGDIGYGIIGNAPRNYNAIVPQS